MNREKITGKSKSQVWSILFPFKPTFVHMPETKNLYIYPRMKGKFTVVFKLQEKISFAAFCLDGGQKRAFHCRYLVAPKRTFFCKNPGVNGLINEY